jgi:acetyl-CoA acetyltransferase
VRDAVIVDAARSPTTRGKAAGSFERLYAVDLLGQVLAGLFARADLDPALSTT